jgi:hypothetical protein
MSWLVCGQLLTYGLVTEQVAFAVLRGEPAATLGAANGFVAVKICRWLTAHYFAVNTLPALDHCCWMSWQAIGKTVGKT